MKCNRCKQEMPEELETMVEGLCEECLPIAVEDIKAEWWDGLDPNDQQAMLQEYADNQE